MNGQGAWPRAVVVAALGALAAVLAVQELLRPAWTAHAGPAGLTVPTLVVGWLVHRHSRVFDRDTATTWRGFAVIAWLLALGQFLRAVTGVGLNPHAAGLSDLALAATGPVAVLLCARLVRSTRGRIRAQVVLDAAVALTALAVLLQMLVPVATRAAGGDADPLLTLGYPVVSSVLCATGLVTLAGVSPPRRAAAGWLLACFASLTVAMVSGALAVATPSVLLDIMTSTAYLAMVATATLALSADPGPRAASEEPVATVPLA